MSHRIKRESDYTAKEIALAKKLAIYYREECEAQGQPCADWNLMDAVFKARYLHMARQLIDVDGVKINNPELTHFYKGDQLKVIDNMDDDERCEGGIEIDEIVTMMDRSSEARKLIIIERTNGKQVQLEKRRFVLHERAKR